MKYTSRLLLPIFYIALLSLTGCGQIVIKERISQESKIEPQSTASDVVYKPEVQRTPNPYLQQQRSVPEAALQLFKKSQAAMQEKNWSEAEKFSHKLTLEYPEFSGPYINLGLIALETGQSEEQAEVFFSKAVNVNAKNLSAYNHLASLKRRQGLFKEAEALYLKALDVWSQHPATHRNLGILYDLYLNDFAKAQIHYQAYQQFLPAPDKQVAGWLIDIKRRTKTVAHAESEEAGKP